MSSSGVQGPFFTPTSSLHVGVLISFYAFSSLAPRLPELGGKDKGHMVFLLQPLDTYLCTR